MKNRLFLTAMRGKAALAAVLALGLALAGCIAPNGTTYTAANAVGGGTQYTVTYAVGAGSGYAPASQTVTAGAAITLPTEGNMRPPTGQTFNGWKDGGGTAYPARQRYTVNANVRFTARWAVGDGTTIVTFNADGGSPTPFSKRINSGSALGTLPAAPTKTSYTFGGWFTSQNGGGTQYTAASTVTGNITLYAKWTPIPPAPGSAPDAPYAVTATVSVSGTDVKLDWVGSAGATSYRISVVGGGVLASTTGTSWTWTHTNVLPGTYTYQIQAVNSWGSSTVKTSNTVVVRLATPSIKSSSGLYHMVRQELQINISPVAHATVYDVYSSASINGPYTKLGSVASTVMPGNVVFIRLVIPRGSGTLYFRVRARCDDSTATSWESEAVDLAIPA
jgi:uncharacterized repeat protein (TIGR02543 family)